MCFYAIAIVDELFRLETAENTFGKALAQVQSPSGGWHLFYKGTAKEGNKKWVYGDIRGKAGHVVLYDAVATLEAARQALSPDVQPVDIAKLSPPRPKSKKKATIERPTSEGLQATTPGGRNNYLNSWVFADVRDGLLTPERETEWRTRALASGLTPTEVDDTLRSAQRAGKEARGKDPFSLSDTGNAQFFAHTYANTLRYDHARNTWFEFNGHHWRPDRCGDADQLALAAIHARQHAAVGNEAASKWATRSLSRPSRDNLLRLARSEPPLAVTGDDWDSDPWLLGVANGVLDLRTGELRDGQPGHLVTKTAPIAFDKDAPAPRWEKFLTEIFADNPELVSYMRRVVGYALTGVTSEQCFWVLHGVGSNGKTTFLA